MAGLADDELDELTPYYSDEEDLARRGGAASPNVASPGVSSPSIGAPTRPDSTAAAAMPAVKFTPHSVSAQPSAIDKQAAADAAELGRVQSTGSGISQIQHGSPEGGIGIHKPHPILGGALRALDTLGSVVAPWAMVEVPGTTLHHQAELGRSRRSLAEDVEEQGKEAQVQESGARSDQAEAMAEKERADAAAAGQPKAKEEKWGEFAGFTDTDGTPLIHEENSGQVLRASDKKPPTGFQPAKTPVAKTPNDFEQFYADWIKDNNFPDTAHNRLIARKQFAEAGQAPQHEPRQMVVGPDGTVIELKPGMKVPQGSKTLSGDLAGAKPNAEELKRSEMAENMNENLDKLEDIVKRRPELFGPIAGRMTQGKMWLGSDDPDVGALNTIKDQIGMAQQSAHSMRSAQHVEAAAASILNGFKNGPDAINSSIKTARDSLKTFTKDVQQGNPSTRKEGGTGGGTKTLSMAAIEKAAKDHNISVDEAKKQAEAQGYKVQ